MDSSSVDQRGAMRKQCGLAEVIFRRPVMTNKQTASSVHTGNKLSGEESKKEYAKLVAWAACGKSVGDERKAVPTVLPQPVC